MTLLTSPDSPTSPIAARSIPAGLSQKLEAIAIMVARIFISYSAYKDLYEMFVDESQATPFAIVSIIVPITSVVFLLIASSKNPKPVVQVEENNGKYTYY